MTKCVSRFWFWEHRKSGKQKKFGREQWGIWQERRQEFQLHRQEGQDFSTAAAELNSFHTWVVSLEPWILQIMVWVIINWETLTIFQLSFATQDRIFNIHVQLDIRRCRNSVNSNGNQVCRAFCRTQWEHILFVCYEGSGVDLAPNITQSSDDHRRDTLSVDRLREIHGDLHSTHGYLLLFTFPPSMLRCSMLEDLMTVFWKKQGT